MTKANSKLVALGTVLYNKSTLFPCMGVMFHGTVKGKHKKIKTFQTANHNTRKALS